MVYYAILWYTMLCYTDEVKWNSPLGAIYSKDFAVL